MTIARHQTTIARQKTQTCCFEPVGAGKLWLKPPNLEVCVPLTPIHRGSSPESGLRRACDLFSGKATPRQRCHLSLQLFSLRSAASFNAFNICVPLSSPRSCLKSRLRGNPHHVGCASLTMFHYRQRSENVESGSLAIRVIQVRVSSSMMMSSWDGITTKVSFADLAIIHVYHRFW